MLLGEINFLGLWVKSKQTFQWVYNFIICRISFAGFACCKAFLENVNHNDNRIKKTGNIFTVEKMDLVGFDYLWRIVLEVPSEEIAMLAVKQLMELSYTWLSSKLKKVSVESKYCNTNG